MLEAPLYLLFCLIALVPLAVHLAWHLRAKRIRLRAPVFIMGRSSVFWRRAGLRRRVLTGVRMGLVICLAVLFAEPGLRLLDRRPGAETQPQQLLVLLDDSLATSWTWDGSSAFDRLRNQVIYRLANSAYQRYGVVSACSEADFRWVSREEAIRVASRLKPAGRTCSFRNAEARLTAARAFTGSSLFRAGLCGAAEDGPEAQDEFCVSVPAGLPNRGIREASCAWRGRCTVLIDAGDRPQGDRLRAWCKGEAEKAVDLGYGRPGSARAALELAFPHACRDRVVRFALSPDAFPPDDVFETVQPQDRPAMVMLVDGDLGGRLNTSSTSYLEPLILALKERGQNLLLRVLRQDELAGERLDGVDVVILADPRPLKPQPARRLERAVRDGAVLLVTAGPRLETWKSGGGLIPGFWKVDGTLEAGLQLAAGTLPEKARAKSRKENRPVLEKRLLPTGFNFDGVSKTAVFSDGNPAALSWSLGAGTVHLWLFPADLSWGEYPLDPAFPLMLGRILGQTGRNASSSEVQTCLIGGACALPNEESQWEFRDPQGNACPELAALLREGNAYLSPGVYQRLRGKYPEPVVQLELPSGDVQAALLQPGLAPASSVPLKPQDAAGGQLFARRVLPLRYSMLFLLFLLVILELVLSRPGKRTPVSEL